MATGASHCLALEEVILRMLVTFRTVAHSCVCSLESNMVAGYSSPSLRELEVSTAGFP